MFGNLFNQKKGNDQNNNTQQASTTREVKTEETVGGGGFGVAGAIGGADILGNPVSIITPVTPIVSQTSKTTEKTTTNNNNQSLPQNQIQEGQQQQEGQGDPPDKNISSSPTARENITALSRLDPRSTKVLTQAQSLAKNNNQPTVEPIHILYGLLYDNEISKTLESFSVDIAKLSKEIEEKQKKGEFNGQPTLGDESKKIFDEAYTTATTRGSSFISPEDILLALFNTTEGADVLKEKGIEREKVENTLSKSGTYTVAKRSMIEKYSIDLTLEARDGRLDPVTGRDREVERLIHILLRRTKNNPIIIGEAGVGKTAIVEGLAQKIVKGDIPKDLAGRKVMQLDLASLIAGASHRGEFEERFRAVIKEAQASTGQLILFIDEIHSLIGAGDSEGTMDASNIIKPYLARGQIQLIGTTTTSEFRKYFEKDKAFERRFQPITVDEPDEEAAIEMLKVLQPKYENFHKVTFLPQALEAAVKLSKKYVGERFLPDKAVDLLDEAGAEVKLLVNEDKRKDSQVNKGDIEKVVSSWTGIPITKLTEDESQKLIKLEELIHKRFIDQEEAVVTIAESIRRGRIGLSAANRPIASFIFLGPTGVGKTELAKTIAEILFGKEESMVRLDMSEYMEKHEVAKLIGAPPGYVGYEEGGQLTEAVRTKPYSIVLLDEVEKAHPDVFNILLQLLEDGRLTDNKGNTVSFKNTVIVATSNLGSSIIQKELSEGGANLNQEEFDKRFANLSKTLMDELHKFFRPELLNRFDGLVIFKPLSPKDMEQISKLSIEKTRKLLHDQGYDLQITQNALDKLAKDGYDPVYGARPLRRLIQTSIENPISLLIISQKVIVGDTILIDFDAQKGEYTFTKVANEKKEGDTKTKNADDKKEGENADAQNQAGATEENGAQTEGQNLTGENTQGNQSNQQDGKGGLNNANNQANGVPAVPQQPQVVNAEPVYGDNNNGMIPQAPGTTVSPNTPQQPSDNGTSGTQMQKTQ